MSGFGGRGSIPPTNYSHGSSVGQSARLLTEWSWVQVPLVTKTYQSLNDTLVPLCLSGRAVWDASYAAVGSIPTRNTRCSQALF